MTAPSKTANQKLSISVKNLGKRFNREWIFRNLSYTFQPSYIYAITGPNGSGKSTLLQVLWGQLPPSTGDLNYSNGDQKIPVEEIFNHLAIATPYLDLIEEFTLLEHLHFHFNLKASRDGMGVPDMLDKMGLTHSGKKYIGNFSSGMKQRVKLGLAFFTKASLLFLDEPTTNLDSEATEWYHKQLNDLPQDCTTFIASNQSGEYPAHAHILNILDFKEKSRK